MKCPPIIPVLLVSLVIGISCYKNEKPSDPSSIGNELGSPVADFPTQVDLGKRERGEIAVAMFKVANRGGSELILDQFRSSCSCSGIERQKEGEFVRVEELHIKPGEEIALRMRITVNSSVGSPMSNGVVFRTNDPQKPNGLIEGVVSQVTGGVYTVPESIILGSLPVGAEIRRVFDVLDDAVAPRNVERVASSHERVKVNILDLSQASPALSKVHAGKRIAQIEVIIDTRVPGPIDAKLTMFLAGADKRFQDINVNGSIHTNIEIFPSTLVLPRSDGNELIYSAKCLVRSRSFELISVTIDSCPSYLTAVVTKDGVNSSQSCLVAITLNPNSPDLAVSSRNQPIRLRCKAGDIESIAELRVIVMQ